MIQTAAQQSNARSDASEVVLRQLSPTSWMAICGGRLIGAIHLDGGYLVHDADGLLVDEADTLAGAEALCSGLRSRQDTFSYSYRAPRRKWGARLVRKVTT